jgi:putative SOS response-associated peptidase YedK
MGIAGLWDSWTEPGKGPLLSFTMLTINAADHPLMSNFHKTTDEKRMIVVLPESQYQEWLEAPAAASMEYLRQYPADKLLATPTPPKKKTETPQLI